MHERRAIIRDAGLTVAEDKRSNDKRTAKRRAHAELLNGVAKGHCQICGKERGEDDHADHVHPNGPLRGMLCRPCNLGLGMFKDNINILQRAIYYVV